MPKFRVTLQQMASTVIEVDADNPEAAIEAAYADEPRLCASCAGHGNPPGIGLDYDWEATVVKDEDGRTVWSEENGNA